MLAEVLGGRAGEPVAAPARANWIEGVWVIYGDVLPAPAELVEAALAVMERHRAEVLEAPGRSLSAQARVGTSKGPTLNGPGEQGPWQVQVTPADLYLSGMSEASRRVMGDGLRIAALILSAGQVGPAELPWQLLRYEHTAALRMVVQQECSPSTANRVLSAVRGVLKTCWRMGQMGTDQYQRATDIVRIVAEKPEQAAGRALTPGEMERLLRVCEQDARPKGVRDALILGLGLYGGLRRREIAMLALADFAVDEAQVTVREGKGRKTRIVPVNSGLAAVCADWLHVRGDAEGFLLWACVKGGGLVAHSRISDQTVYDVVLNRAAEAGIRRFTPHDMRRTYSGELLDAGVDLATVQKLMGHSSDSTTAGYDRRGVQARRKAAEMLHMRWERRFGDELYQR